MENTTKNINFVRKCVLAIVIIAATALGLAVMPMLASASPATTTVQVEIKSDMALNVTNPPNNHIMSTDQVTLTVDVENVNTIKVYIGDTSGAPIDTITVGEEFTDTINILVTFPAGTNNGAYNIILVADNFTGSIGTRTDSVIVIFTSAPPIINNVTPPSGPTTGGTEIIIKGNNFTPDTTVTVGGVECKKLTYVNQNTLKCITKEHSAGNVDIVVTSPNGSATMEEGFRYVDMGVLVPNTGIFRIGNKMISLYELIGMVALGIAIIAIIIFVIIGAKRKDRKNQKKVVRSSKPVNRKTSPKNRKTTRR